MINPLSDPVSFMIVAFVTLICFLYGFQAMRDWIDKRFPPKR